MALLDLLKFVTDGAWGAGLDRVLSAPEGDTNIYNLAAAIQDLIDNPVEGVTVSNIAVVGRQLIFYMSDASTIGPFDLPVAQPRFRGTWIPETFYSVFDIVTDSQYGTFMVGVDHTADFTFDPAAANSAGDYYIKLAPPNVELSSEATGTTFVVLEEHWNTFVECTATMGCEVTLPAIATENTQVTFRQGREYPITFVIESGGNPIKGVIGYDLITGGEGSVVTCKFRNEAWRIWGRLAPVSA